MKVYLQWEELRKLPACRKGLKVCSTEPRRSPRLLAKRAKLMKSDRACGKQGDLLGVVESAGGMNTPLALFGMREAFVTLPTEGRLSPSLSVSLKLTPR